MPEGDMALKSVKLSAERRKEMAAPSAVASDGPSYPWGTRVTLDNDTLELLGIKTLPEVGGTLYLGANVKVVSVSDNEHTGQGGKTERHRSVELQITEMGLSDEHSSHTDADTIYAKKEK